MILPVIIGTLMVCFTPARARPQEQPSTNLPSPDEIQPQDLSSPQDQHQSGNKENQLLSTNSQNNSNGNATILTSEFVDSGNGNFYWKFETSDGFKSEQKGVPGKSRTAKTRANFETSEGNGTESDGKNEDDGGEEIVGSYSYKAPNGEIISVTYTAGVNGFRPKGAHIPTLPPNFGSESRNDKKNEHENSSLSEGSKSDSSLQELDSTTHDQNFQQKISMEDSEQSMQSQT